MKISIPSLIFLFCFTSFSALLEAQPTAYIGAELEHDQKIYDHRLYPVEGGNYLSIFTEEPYREDVFGSHEIIVLHDKSGKVLARLESEKKNPFYDVVYFDGKLYVMQSDYDKKTNRKTVDLVRVNIPNLNLTSEKVRVLDAEIKNRYNTTAFFVDPAGAHLLVIFEDYRWAGTLRQGVTYYTVYDKEFNQISRNEVPSAFDSKETATSVLDADKLYFEPDGTVYVVGYPEDGELILTYLPIDGESIETRLEIPFDEFSVEERFMDDSGLCHIIGTAIDDDISIGICYLQIDVLNMTISKVKLTPFDKDFLMSILSAKDRKRMEKSDAEKLSLGGFNILHFLDTEGGQKYVIAEQMQPGTNVKVYYFADIIVMRLNAEGEVEWTTTLPKRQRVVYGASTIAITGCGYRLDGEDLYLLYNTAIENLEGNADQSKNAETKGHIGSTAAITKIAPSGEISHNRLRIEGIKDFNFENPTGALADANGETITLFTAFKDIVVGKVVY